MVKTSSRPRLAAVIGAALLASACVTNTPAPIDAVTVSEGADPATWDLRPGANVGPRTHTLQVVVSRIRCSSGRQGAPQPPTITATATRVEITFTISPSISEGFCQQTPGVPYEVDLGEPLGNRTLVDGVCSPGSGASTTVFCLADGVRYRPGHRP